MGHNTEDCVTLKDKIEELIQVGQLQHYVKEYRAVRRSSVRDASPVRSVPRGRSPRRPKDKRVVPLTKVDPTDRKTIEGRISINEVEV